MQHDISDLTTRVEELERSLLKLMDDGYQEGTDDMTVPAEWPTGDSVDCMVVAA
jgi:hypothetical protein